MWRKALVFGLFLLFLGHIDAQERIFLWKGYNVYHGNQVTLQPFIAENNNTGLAVIVCPGGSYYWLDEQNEGDRTEEHDQHRADIAHHMLLERDHGDAEAEIGLRISMESM